MYREHWDWFSWTKLYHLIGLIFTPSLPLNHLIIMIIFIRYCFLQPPLLLLIIFKQLLIFLKENPLLVRILTLKKGLYSCISMSFEGTIWTILCIYVLKKKSLQLDVIIQDEQFYFFAFSFDQHLAFLHFQQVIFTKFLLSILSIFGKSLVVLII